jgi:hypothetical protein
MKMKLLHVIACAASLGLSQASAATLMGTTTDASGINGLVVDGLTYDVTFVYTDYENAYSSTQPYFSGNQTGALDASTAITNALNSLGVSGLVNGPGTSTLAVIVPYGVPFENFVATYLSECPYTTSCPSEGWYDESYDAYNESTGFEYTTFSLIATPLPAALPLFATVLGSGGLFGWRRKRKNAAAPAA